MKSFCNSFQRPGQHLEHPPTNIHIPVLGRIGKLGHLIPRHLACASQNHTFNLSNSPAAYCIRCRHTCASRKYHLSKLVDFGGGNELQGLSEELGSSKWESEHMVGFVATTT